MKIYRVTGALQELSLTGQKTFRAHCTDEPIEKKKHFLFNSLPA